MVQEDEKVDTQEEEEDAITEEAAPVDDEIEKTEVSREEQEPQEAEEKPLEEKLEKRVEAEEGIVEEKIYTVPLGRAWISPRKDRAPKAIRILKSFIERHMKPESIILTEEVNERIWRRGVEKPPRRIRIRALKDEDGKVSVRLAEGD